MKENQPKLTFDKIPEGYEDAVAQPTSPADRPVQNQEGAQPRSAVKGFFEKYQSPADKERAKKDGKKTIVKFFAEECSEGGFLRGFVEAAEELRKHGEGGVSLSINPKVQNENEDPILELRWDRQVDRDWGGFEDSGWDEGSVISKSKKIYCKPVGETLEIGTWNVFYRLGKDSSKEEFDQAIVKAISSAAGVQEVIDMSFYDAEERGRIEIGRQKNSGLQDDKQEIRRRELEKFKDKFNEEKKQVITDLP